MSDNKKKKVYLDYAATTPVDSRVKEAMLPYFDEKFGNPASIHSFGQEAKKAIESAREKVANFISANAAEEIIFTSSATESNNLALKGIAWANQDKGKHIIISPIEHSCVRNAAKWLEKQGFELSYLSVDKYGLVDLEDLKEKIRQDTVLVSVIHGSNEFGTLQPIRDIGEICAEKGVYFHTDVVQSFGKTEIDVESMNIDLLSASSHKMYGPKGAACLYLRKGSKIDSLFHGGGQEGGYRASTSNVPGIIGFAETCKICQDEGAEEAEKIRKLRDKLIDGVSDKVEEAYLNGHPEKRLVNNANFWFKGLEGESILMRLDMEGIAVSTGSACSSGNLQANPALTAIGLRPEQAHGSIRFSLGKYTTDDEIDYVLEVLPEVIKNLREISPF